MCHGAGSRYVFDEGARLGAGKQGVVYAGALAGAPSEGVAVKVCPARTAAVLPPPHVHIVPVLACGVDEGEAHVVMPRALGPLSHAVGAAVARGGVGGAEHLLVVRVAFAALVSAVNHCHAHGIVHGDISHHNALLSAAGVVWLSDFGMARRAPVGVLEKRHPRFHGGDAPEARRGGLLDPHATEVYMCGAALLRLLSPSDAHPSRKPARVCHADDGTRTLVLPADRLQHAPAGAVELLRGMLAHAPEHRWRLQDILSHEYVAGAPDRLPVALVVAAAAVGAHSSSGGGPVGG